MGFSADIQGAESAEEALGLIAASLPPELNISRLGLRMEVPGSDQIMSVAIWSRGPTMLFAGLSHPKTGALGELFERVIRTAKADRRELGEDAAPIVESILLGEGHRSVMQVPLIASEGNGVLAIVSSRHRAFTDEDLRDLEILGGELAPRLVMLGKEAMEALASRSVRLPEKGPLVEPGDGS